MQLLYGYSCSDFKQTDEVLFQTLCYKLYCCTQCPVHMDNLEPDRNPPHAPQELDSMADRGFSFSTMSNHLTKMTEVSLAGIFSARVLP